MVQVLIDNDEYDSIPKLSRAMAKTMTNGEQMQDWYDALIEKSMEISEHVKALNIGEYETERAAGKIAYCRIAARWIEHRLIELKLPVPYPAKDPRQQQLTQAEACIIRLKNQVRALGGNPDERS